MVQTTKGFPMFHLPALPITSPLLRDANASGAGTPFGNLPEWNLDDLYPGENAPELKRDLDWLEQACASFADDYENKLSTLDAAGLLDCVLRNEKINQIAGRIMSYAGLRYYQLTTDAGRAKFMSDMQEKITNFTTPLVFFTLELNTLEDNHLSDLLAQNEDLARYKPIFDRIRAMKPYQLSDEMEKFLHDLGVVGDAWERLFDETIAGLQFDVNGETLGIEGTLNLMTDPDRANREAGARELADVFGENIKTFARVHNTQAKEKEVMDRWRGMETAQTSRHLSNQVEPEVVEALRNAVVAAYPKLSHRYYALKKKWLGLDTMQVWDRNAPLPMEDPKIVDWPTAEQMVMDAYTAFDPRMGELTKPFFTKGWIDAGVKPGKAPGAFAHPTVTDVHPYVMLNYLGKPRDVMTLAHELGHGVHQVLAAGQGAMLSSTPLTLAATAPHFIHSPFYVYAYAFGDGLVNALYAVYAEGNEGFEDKYFDMLKAGGSKHHKELLAPFGLDASDPAFWDKGLSMISDMIDELEAMEGQ